MTQARRIRRKNKVHKPSEEKVTRKDRLKIIIMLILFMIAAFLLYYFVLKGNIHEH